MSSQPLKAVSILLLVLGRVSLGAASDAGPIEKGDGEGSGSPSAPERSSDARMLGEFSESSAGEMGRVAKDMQIEGSVLERTTSMLELLERLKEVGRRIDGTSTLDAEGRSILGQLPDDGAGFDVERQAVGIFATYVFEPIIDAGVDLVKGAAGAGMIGYAARTGNVAQATVYFEYGHEQLGRATKAGLMSASILGVQAVSDGVGGTAEYVAKEAERVSRDVENVVGEFMRADWMRIRPW